MENFTIDRQNKTFVFDDGEVLPIPKDKQKQVLRSKAGEQSKREAMEKWEQWQQRVPLGETGHALVNSTSESLFGNLGDTAANYVVSGIKSFNKGEGQEEMGYLDRVLDHFYAMQEGRKEQLSGLQKKHPEAATVGKGLGIAGELGSLYGVPAWLALPAMGAGASETSFLEPGEKSKEVSKDAITGIVLDKFFKGLGNVAGHRETQRGVKNLIQSTEEGNLAEIQRAAAATDADKLRFTNQTASREAQLQNLSKLQNAENQAFQKATNSSVSRIAKTLGKTPVGADVLGVEEFIDSAINTSAHAATSEANYASRFLRSIFKGDKGGKITGESLKKGMQALDEAILKNEGATRQILTDYKNFVSKSLPDRLASSYVFEKWAPRLAKSSDALETNLMKTLNSSPEIHGSIGKKLGANYVRSLNSDVQKTIKDVLQNYKNGFQGMDSALVKQQLEEAIKLSPTYQKLMTKVDSLFPQLPRKDAFRAIPKFQEIHGAIERYPSMVSERVAKSIDRYKPDMGLDFTTKGGITSAAIQKAPIAPNVLPPPPAVRPSQTIQPNLQPVPTMPAPEGVYGKLAQGLESMRDSGVKGAISSFKNNAPAAILGKLAGIPVGKVAVGAAAGATGLRALTSPSMAGNVLRTGLEQGARGGIAIADELARKYPSYHDGVVEDPQEKRSLTKEIENIPDLRLEEKAVLQSKINRGKPLFERLQ